MTARERERFQAVILGYYRRHSRSFPWRETNDPYRILVSEVMLQQTQTVRVTQKYREFLEAFPSIEALATSPLAGVLRRWQGLGYNRRARYLKSCAEMIVSRFDGSFPRDRETLRRLPGIGAYTSGAICAFAFHQPVAFIDTNIRRVFIHFFFQDVDNVRDSQLIPLVEETVFRPDPRTWYYAVMDYGAMLARSFPNANRRSAHYVRQSPFENSNRQIRGRILKILAETPRSRSDLIDALDFDDERISGSLDDLAAEGLIVSESDVVSLPGDIEPQQD